MLLIILFERNGILSACFNPRLEQSFITHLQHLLGRIFDVAGGNVLSAPGLAVAIKV